MPKIVVSTVPKKDLIIVLTYLDKLSPQIHTKINRIKKNNFLYRNLRIVLQTKWKLIHFFKFKNKIPVFLRSAIVCKFKWGDCTLMAKYVSTEFLHLLETKWKGIMILQQNKITDFAIIHLVLTIFFLY